MAAGRFLTAQQRLQMQAFPQQISHDDLTLYFTLTTADLEQVTARRSAHNQLGFALTLCAIRYLGFVPDLLDVPTEVLELVAGQLRCEPDLKGYASRDKTRTDHLQAALSHLGFRRPTPHDMQLETFVIEQATAHERPSVLLADTCERLLRERILRPSVGVLERLVLGSWPPGSFQEKKQRYC